MVRGSLPTLFKILIKPAVRGSLHTFFQIRTKPTVRGSLHPFFNSGQTGGPWISASFFFKFGPNRCFVDPCPPCLKFWSNPRSVDPYIPFFQIWTKPTVRGSLHHFFFKIRTKSAVRGSLHLFYRTKPAVLGSLHPFFNSGQTGGPWILYIPFLKIQLIQRKITSMMKFSKCGQFLICGPKCFSIQKIKSVGKMEIISTSRSILFSTENWKTTHYFFPLTSQIQVCHCHMSHLWHDCY